MGSLKSDSITYQQYYCPVCEKSVQDWVPFSRSIGCGKKILEPEKRLCPNCGSFERTRHFWLYLQKMRLLDKNPRFLHFAPERGLAPKLRSILGDKYLTADLNMPMVDAKEDITQLSFSDCSFDFIYCSNVLEHVNNDLAAMRELFRVLAPGGAAIVQVPIRGKITYENHDITTPNEKYIHFGQSDHVRYYGEDVAGRLAKTGFMVKAFYMPDILGLAQEEINIMNLGKREIIHKCTKE